MATEPQLGLDDPLRRELSELGKRWGHLLALGIVFIVLGTLAIAFSFVFTFILTISLGILIAVSGVLQIVTALWAGPWSGRLLHLLLGILYVATGMVMIKDPIAAAAAITLILAVVYIAGGLMRIAFATTHGGPGTGWVLANGIITLVLGIAIWWRWPSDSIWVIGLFVGVDMLMLGWSWVMLGTAARSAVARGV